MWRSLSSLACFMLGTLCASQVPSVGDDHAAGVKKVSHNHEAFIRRCFTITDLVLKHHIDPPTRQELFLG
jgi:hypothetical protein